MSYRIFISQLLAFTAFLVRKLSLLLRESEGIDILASFPQEAYHTLFGVFVSVSP